MWLRTIVAYKWSLSWFTLIIDHSSNHVFEHSPIVSNNPQPHSLHLYVPDWKHDSHHPLIKQYHRFIRSRLWPLIMRVGSEYQPLPNPIPKRTLHFKARINSRSPDIGMNYTNLTDLSLVRGDHTTIQRQAMSPNWSFAIYVTRRYTYNQYDCRWHKACGHRVSENILNAFNFSEANGGSWDYGDLDITLSILPVEITRYPSLNIYSHLTKSLLSIQFNMRFSSAIAASVLAIMCVLEKHSAHGSD